MQDTAPAPAAGAGGSLWKNSRPEKGSVTAYAKDYQEKLKAKKHSDKAGKATAEGRRLARQKSQAHFSEKGWTLSAIIMFYVAIMSWCCEQLPIYGALRMWRSGSGPRI